MPSAIQTANATATGTLVARACNLLHIQVRSGATAGSAVLRDGGAGGTVKMTINTPASAAAHIAIPIPSPGLAFDTDCHVTLTTADAITVVFK